MKNIYILSCCMLVTLGFSQVGISTTPDPSAELEVSSTTRGFLLPRILNASKPAGNLTANVGMMNYLTDGNNTGAAGIYYVKNTTDQWKPMSGDALGWTIDGKSANTAARFLGTTAVPVGSADFVFKTNSVERMRFLATSGFLGIGTTVPSTFLHLSGTSPLLRIEDGTQGANKLMVSDATGVMTWASPGSVFNPDWDTFGNGGTNPATNFLGTTETGVSAQDLVIKTNNIERIRVQADGNIRMHTAATLSQLLVQGNSPNEPMIRGVNTNTTINTFSYGVIGDTKSTDLGSYAIRGQMLDLDGTSGIGVLGQTTPIAIGFCTGVLGRGWINLNDSVITGNTVNNYPIPGQTFSGINGVYGFLNFVTGTGVYGFNSNTSIGTAFAVYGDGNFTATGTKSASVPTTHGNQLVYCKESPEMWFEDFGFAQLQNGTAHIKLEDLFLETVFIDDAHKMHVVLQEQAESKGLYFVVDADHKGFTVKEKKGGNSNAAFSYSIMAKRRFYQDQRFGVDANQPFGNNLLGSKDIEVTTTDPKVMKAFVEKAVAEKMQNLKSKN
jgi:hypothetical protein